MMETERRNQMRFTFNDNERMQMDPLSIEKLLKNKNNNKLINGIKNSKKFNKKSEKGNSTKTTLMIRVHKNLLIIMMEITKNLQMEYIYIDI